MQIITMKPAVDWLTLTGWEHERIRMLWEDWNNHPKTSEMKLITRGGYRGYQGAQSFFGTSYQAGYPHGLVTVSGVSAHMFARTYQHLFGDLNCTRIDVQLTVPYAQVEDLDALYALLTDQKNHPWSGSGKVPVITRYQNSTGGRTVYVGRPSSDRLVRFYTKEADGVNHIRLEVQLRRHLAQHRFNAFVHQGEMSLGNEIQTVLARMPSGSVVNNTFWDMLVDAPPGEHKHTKEPRGLDARVMWIRKVVIPAMKRLVTDGRADTARQVLMEIQSHLENTPGWGRADVEERVGTGHMPDDVLP